MWILPGSYGNEKHWWVGKWCFYEPAIINSSKIHPKMFEFSPLVIRQ
jgi:hypothetical protein